MISDKLIIKRRIAFAARFQTVEKVIDYLVERQLIVQLGAIGVDIRHINEISASVLAEIHN